MDHQRLAVNDTIRDVTVYSNEIDFTNATFTLGLRHELMEGIELYSNIGTAWRAPNVAELYSFGYHFSRIQFGLWRYNFEPNITTPIDRVYDESVRQVNSERSLKWVTGMEIKKGNVDAEVVIHANRISDYIFLRPFGITTNVAGTFPFFIYDQTSAIFLGSDIDVRFQHSAEWSSEMKAAYVYASDTDGDQPFIEIPPLQLSYVLDYTKDNWGFELSAVYSGQQWHAPPVFEPISFQNGQAEVAPDQIFDFMAVPQDFVLFGAGVSYELGGLNVTVRADNLFNLSYRRYTDRLRYFSDAQGRNIALAIGYDF